MINSRRNLTILALTVMCLIGWFGEWKYYQEKQEQRDQMISSFRKIGLINTLLLRQQISPNDKEFEDFFLLTVDIYKYESQYEKYIGDNSVAEFEVRSLFKGIGIKNLEDLEHRLARIMSKSEYEHQVNTKLSDREGATYSAFIDKCLSTD